MKDKEERLILDGLKEARKDAVKLKDAVSEITAKTQKGMTPKDAMSLPPGYLENIYSQAYQLYNTGKYSDASNMFRLLIMFNAMEAKYVMGLAACYHMMKDYVSAIQTYTLCSVLDSTNPIPHYHSSDCYIQMREYVSAMLCLELAIERAGDSPEYAKMNERALLGLEGLRKQAIEHPTEKVPESNRILRERPDFFA